MNAPRRFCFSPIARKPIKLDNVVPNLYQKEGSFAAASLWTGLFAALVRQGKAQIIELMELNPDYVNSYVEKQRAYDTFLTLAQSESAVLRELDDVEKMLETMEDVLNQKKISGSTTPGDYMAQQIDEWKFHYVICVLIAVQTKVTPVTLVSDHLVPPFLCHITFRSRSQTRLYRTV